ncbi:MAG: AAA family ATPase [Candidatus Hodarchaeota archaeon]
MKEKVLEKTPLSIAVVGKGGVGKTVITTLLAKVISQQFNYKLLLIDADPAHPHLSNMVKLVPKKSLEAIRTDLIENTLKKEKTPKKLAKNIDFEVYNSMAESKDFCLFSIGQPEGPGCFCPSNALLKKVIESISKDFDIVLIDCEAGLEQINRLVLESVDVILIVVDISLRSVDTANSIRNSAKKFTNYKKLGIVVNKVKGNVDLILEKLNQLNFPLLGTIPEDETIIKQDLEGKPIIDLPEDSPSLEVVKNLVKEILSM